MSWKRLQTIEREVDAVHLKSHRHTVSCPKAIRRLDHPIHYAGVAATAFEQDTAAQCEMADGVGFEPTVSLHPRRYSSPVPYTARPPIRFVPAEEREA